MTLPEIKNKISSGEDIKERLIFLYSDTDYIPVEYAHALAKIRKSKVVNLESVEEVPETNPFIESNNTYIYRCDSLNVSPAAIPNLIIITRKITKDVAAELEDEVVEVPKLEEWQIEDWINVTCPGLDEKIVSWLIANYDGNVNRIALELDKLTLFPEDTRKYIFQEFYDNGIFNSIGEMDEKNFATALQNKDRQALIGILSDMNNQEIEPVTTSALIQTNFKRMIKVWLNKNPNQDNTGLKSTQIWAISKLPRVYNKEQLVRAFKYSSEISYKVKSGELPVELILDYLVTRCMA